jgi:hypothetical protein
MWRPLRGGEHELAVTSRSMLQIMATFASLVDVPQPHLKDHSAAPGLENSGKENKDNKVRIYCGKDKPGDTFAAVRYRGYWFWVDEGDWQTKRALSAVIYFFTLGESTDEKLPLVTIPAQ